MYISADLATFVLRYRPPYMQFLFTETISLPCLRLGFILSSTIHRSTDPVTFFLWYRKPYGNFFLKKIDDIIV